VTAILVDWENFAIALRCAGYSLSPAESLRGLIRSAVEPDARAEISIVTPRHTPPAADRVALKELSDSLTQVAIHTTENRKENAADIELGFLAGREVEQSTARPLTIVSADRDLAQVADLAAKALARSPEPRPVTLAFVRRAGSPDPRPALANTTEILQAFRRSGIASPSHQPRPANDYDRAAWGIARAVAGGDGRAYEATCLHTDQVVRSEKPSVKERPVWWASVSDYSNLAELEDVDEMLWLVAHCLVGTTTRIRAEEMHAKLAAKAPRLVDAIPDIVDALVTTDLVRTDLDGNLTPRMALHEGVLFPARRVVLWLATSANHVRMQTTLAKLHARRRNYRHIEIGRQVEESWGMVGRLLKDSWKIVHDRSVEVEGGKRHNAWVLRPESAFVTSTLASAQVILSLVESRGEVTLEYVESAMPEGVRYSRWLRAMHDTGLLTYDRATEIYRRGDAQLT
jgi:hypothetical protein